MAKKMLNFVYPDAFSKKWDTINLTEKDKREMESQIHNHERQSGYRVLGTVIRGTGGAIKWRFSGEDSTKGKSGANRIIYFVYSNRTYYFLDVYEKGQKENLSDVEKNAIKKFISEFKKTINKNGF